MTTILGDKFNQQEGEFSARTSTPRLIVCHGRVDAGRCLFYPPFIFHPHTHPHSPFTVDALMAEAINGQIDYERLIKKMSQA